MVAINPTPVAVPVARAITNAPATPEAPKAQVDSRPAAAALAAK